MPSSTSRTLLIMIVTGLLLWGTGLAVAVFLDWPDRWRLLRALIVVGFVGLFLAGWLALLWRTGRLN